MKKELLNSPTDGNYLNSRGGMNSWDPAGNNSTAKGSLSGPDMLMQPIFKYPAGIRPAGDCGCGSAKNTMPVAPPVPDNNTMLQARPGYATIMPAQQNAALQDYAKADL